MKLKKYLLVYEDPITGEEELLFETDSEAEAQDQLNVEIGRGAEETWVVTDYSEEWYKTLKDSRY